MLGIPPKAICKPMYHWPLSSAKNSTGAKCNIGGDVKNNIGAKSDIEAKFASSPDLYYTIMNGSIIAHMFIIYSL